MVVSDALKDKQVYGCFFAHYFLVSMLFFNPYYIKGGFMKFTQNNNKQYTLKFTNKLYRGVCRVMFIATSHLCHQRTIQCGGRC